MTHRVRIWIAAGVTALFLAAISLAGIAIRDSQPRAATAGPPAAAASDDTGVLDTVLAEADRALRGWLGDDE